MCLYIGSIFYALLISNLSHIVSNLDRGRNNFKEFMGQVNGYMKVKEVCLAFHTYHDSDSLSHGAHIAPCHSSPRT